MNVFFYCSLVFFYQLLTVVLSGFYSALVYFLSGSNCDFIRFFYRFLHGLYSLFNTLNTLFWCMYSFLIQLLQVAYNLLCVVHIIFCVFRIIP